MAGIYRVGVWYACARTHTIAQTYLMCVICICQRCLPSSPHFAFQSVSQCICTKKKKQQQQKTGQHFSVWVAGICLSIALAFSSVFLCLSPCQADSHYCLQEERTHLSQLKGSPQRELRSPSISVGFCDCQRTDKVPSGQCCALRQAGILRCMMSAV